MDAVELLEKFVDEWPRRTLVYLDPPYYDKGPDLYYNSYKKQDHFNVARSVRLIKDIPWIISYDDVGPIQKLYSNESWLKYQIGYSARERTSGREAMFFSDGLQIPRVTGSMIEVDRWSSNESENRHLQISFA